MSVHNYILIFAALLATWAVTHLAASPAIAADGLTTLEEQMTGAEFERAGLEKLSPEELEFLNSWIRGKRLATPAKVQPSTQTPTLAATSSSSAPSTSGNAAATAGRSQPAAPAGQPGQGFEYKVKRTEITSRLVGKFAGWNGKTEFVLENGMVWKQAESGTHGRPAIDSPQVRIEPKIGGSWRLYVEGSNRSVKVKRIK